MIEPGWYEVDESGHVPYVAAELPPGHQVLLDAAGNIGAIVPVEAPQSERAASESEAQQQQEEAPSVEEAAGVNQVTATGFFASPAETGG